MTTIEYPKTPMIALDVAVVIVTYRSAQLTLNCIASIESERRLSGLAIRVVVVDNASGDFAEIARAVETNHWESWVTVLLAPRNGGFAYGNNFGIRHAYEDRAPDYVHLVNPDTEIRPGAISALVEFLETHPDAAIAGSGFEDADGTDWPIAFKFPSLLSELSGGLELGLVSRLLRRQEVPQTMSKLDQPIDWICGASMMVRPAVLQSIGALDEHYFLYFEETDFCFRARKAGFLTWYVPESRVMHIRGQSTKVTERVAVKRRLPAYWYESRRRYFYSTQGLAKAIAIDLVAVFAHSLGWLKRLVLGRMHNGVPHFIRDLVKHSVIWPGNRALPPVVSFHPSNDAQQFWKSPGAV